MSRQGQHQSAISFFLAGLLVGLMIIGGGWGEAHGQTAGATPTPSGARMSIEKTANRANARPGQNVVFTIRVQNIGNAPARNVVVRDDVPAAFEIINATSSAGTATVSGPTVAVAIDELNPGQTVIVTVVTRLRPDATGELSNTAQVTASDTAGVQLPPQRATATLSAGVEDGDDASGGAANGNDRSGSAGANGAEDDANRPRAQLSNTGIDADLQWTLFVLGLGFLLAGSVLFFRARKTA